MAIRECAKREGEVLSVVDLEFHPIYRNLKLSNPKMIITKSSKHEGGWPLEGQVMSEYAGWLR